MDANLDLGLSLLAKSFAYVDVYTDPNNSDEVVGITFTNDEGYLQWCAQYEKALASKPGSDATGTQT